MAKFYIPVNSKGSVGVSYHSYDDDNTHFQKMIDYEVGDVNDAGKVFEIELSDEELKILFD